MPELPEVENIARALKNALPGKQLTGISARYALALKPSPGAVRRSLTGREVTGISRHGKYIFIDFESRDAISSSPGVIQLMLHLRMTGQIFVNPDYKCDKHVRLVFDFDGQKVYYRDVRKFGGFSLLKDKLGPAAIPHVGPDMLQISTADWLGRIRQRQAPIKNLLLNQGIAAGLGNIYADEALFYAGLSPLAQPVELSEISLRALLKQARRVLRLAIKGGGTTFQDFVDFKGKPGNFKKKLRVYGRTGENCFVCDSTIERLKIGGRSAHFCPICQPTRTNK